MGKMMSNKDRKNMTVSNIDIPYNMDWPEIKKTWNIN